MRDPASLPLRSLLWPALVLVIAVLAAVQGVWLVAVPLGVASLARGADLLRQRG